VIAAHRPLLSVVIIGRNDGYMGDYLYRLATSVSFLARNAAAEQLLDDLEILIVDWASEHPLAGELPLDPVARAVTSLLEITPAQVRSEFGALRWLPSTAVNAGVRRARGEFILFTDSDCLWSRPALAALGRLLRGEVALPVSLHDTFCYLRRYQVPWATVHRKPRLDEWSRLVTLLVAGMRGESPSAACLGGFSAGQLMHRELWHAARGYDERLDRGWGWADNDLMLRVTQEHAWIDLGGHGVFGLHMEHWPDGADRGARDPNAVNPMIVSNQVAANGPNWGLGRLAIGARRCDAPSSLPTGEGYAVPLSGHSASPMWQPGPEAAAFVRRTAVHEDPEIPAAAIVAAAQIALADRPLHVYWFGPICPPVLQPILKASPAAELFLINPWPEGASDRLPFHPGTLASFLGASCRFSGWARVVQGDPQTALDRIDASTIGGRPVELAWVSPQTPTAVVRRLAERLAPGGVMLSAVEADPESERQQRQEQTPTCVTRMAGDGALLVTTRPTDHIRSEDMPVTREATPVEPSEAARALRTVFDMLLQDKALREISPDGLPWREPILVIRSAPLDRFEALIQRITEHTPAPNLHVLSHARDEASIRAAAKCDLTFHAYPTPGPYRLEGLPEEMLDRLRSLRFGTLFFLDTGTSSDMLGEVERLLAGIRENRAVSFRGDGTFAKTPDWRQRGLAEEAFLRLIDWYHVKLDPGFPAGPVLREGEPSAAGR
jgi:hypothetical protein